MSERTPSEQSVVESIEADTMLAGAHSRRAFVLGTAATAAAAVLSHSEEAAAAAPKSYAATPPAGFTPMSAPGKVVRISKENTLEDNKYYPKPDDAVEMLRRALQEFTGKATMAEAAGLFVHKDDKVCVKVNGIALKKMGTNKELVLPFIQAMIDSGVPPENITVLEQWAGFLAGTRISASNVPKGVKVAVHANGDATMQEREIVGTGRKTKFVRTLTESTAVINFSLVKDHSICGYTGCLKNLTHGCIVNPQEFHLHNASPQIALLASQDVITSRLRLNITDGFKLMADGGPLFKKENFVIPHHSVYVATDPVAMDMIGWEMVEQARTDFKLPSLKAAGREPTYIAKAGALGLGVADRSAIALQHVKI